MGGAATTTLWNCMGAGEGKDNSVNMSDLTGEAVVKKETVPTDRSPARNGDHGEGEGDLSVLSTRKEQTEESEAVSSEFSDLDMLPLLNGVDDTVSRAGKYLAKQEGADKQTASAVCDFTQLVYTMSQDPHVPSRPSVHLNPKP